MEARNVASLTNWSWILHAPTRLATRDSQLATERYLNPSAPSSPAPSTSSEMFTLFAVTLAALAAAAPVVPEGSKLLTRADASRINWRGADGQDQNKLGTCGRGPVLGYGNGDRLQV